MGSDHPNYGNVKSDLDTEKSSRDLRRLLVTQTSVKGHQLMQVWKNPKGIITIIKRKENIFCCFYYHHHDQLITPWEFFTSALAHHHHHHHHHVVPLARISLTLSRHFSPSFIASGRSSGLHPVSSHSCCILLGHIWGSIGLHHLWARPCFSSSVLHVWFV